MTFQSACLRHAVAENLDALVRLDLRGYGVPTAIYDAARQLIGGPLLMHAADKLTGTLTANDTVVIGTGFVFPPWNKGELDGVVGAAVVARALEHSMSVKPVLVVEPELVDGMSAVLRTAGLQPRADAARWRAEPHTVLVRSFTRDANTASQAAADFVQEYRPKAMISIERPGRSASGVYHTGTGIDVTSLAIKFDYCFEAARSSGCLTVAIGDLGNELGMGAIREAVSSRVPHGRACGCPCNAGIAAVVEADITLVGAVSDWVAYGLAAAIAYTTGKRQALHDDVLERNLLSSAVEAGFIDGSGYAVPAVDGVRDDYNGRLVAQMGDILDYAELALSRYGSMFDKVESLREGVTS